MNFLQNAFLSACLKWKGSYHHLGDSCGQSEFDLWRSNAGSSQVLGARCRRLVPVSCFQQITPCHWLCLQYSTGSQSFAGARASSSGEEAAECRNGPCCSCRSEISSLWQTFSWCWISHCKCWYSGVSGVFRTRALLFRYTLLCMLAEFLPVVFFWSLLLTSFNSKSKIRTYAFHLVFELKIP